MPFGKAYSMYIIAIIRRALKGRNIPAGGEAPGLSAQCQFKALKGRNNLRQ